jgi:hypothetical protein
MFAGCKCIGLGAAKLAESIDICPKQKKKTMLLDSPDSNAHPYTV